jgi:hypothetical protein
MAWDALSRDARDENTRDREKLIGIYIGILAVALAIASVGGGNAAKDAMRANLDATNMWAFFQAKNMRRHVIRMETDALELKLLAEPQMPEAAKSAIRTKIAEYRKQDEVLTKDPDKPAEKREGLDQLFEKAKALEAERDLALKRDPYFDYGAAMLQIAIVLASIALLSSGSLLVIASAAIALLGFLLTVNGFTLAVALPFLG